MNPASTRALASCADHRHAGRVAIAVGRARAADQHHRRQHLLVALRSGQGPGDVEAVGGNPHRLVAGNRERGHARRRRGDVLACHFERLRRNAQPHQPTSRIGPQRDLQVAAGVLHRQRVAPGVEGLPRGLDALGAHVGHRHGDFGLRRDVGLELGARRQAAQPRRQRRVAAEEHVGQHHRIGGDRVDLLGRLATLGQRVDRLALCERGLEGDLGALDGGGEVERLRLPLRVVAQFDVLDDGAGRRAELAGAAEHPAFGLARDRQFLAAEHPAAEEDHVGIAAQALEAASGRGRRRLRLGLRAGHAAEQQQRGESGTGPPGTIIQGHEEHALLHPSGYHRCLTPPPCRR